MGTMRYGNLVLWRALVSLYQKGLWTVQLCVVLVPLVSQALEASFSPGCRTRPPWTKT